MALSKKRQKNAELLKAMRNPNEPIPPALNELEKLSGKVYAKLKRDASEWYRMEKGKKDYKAYVLEYAKNTRPDQFKIIKQNPDWRFSPVLGSMCRMKTRGWPDFVHAEDEYIVARPGRPSYLQTFTLQNHFLAPINAFGGFSLWSSQNAFLSA